jgi:hypothetical protein
VPSASEVPKFATVDFGNKLPLESNVIATVPLPIFTLFADAVLLLPIAIPLVPFTSALFPIATPSEVPLLFISAPLPITIFTLAPPVLIDVAPEPITISLPAAAVVLLPKATDCVPLAIAPLPAAIDNEPVAVAVPLPAI